MTIHRFYFLFSWPDVNMQISCYVIRIGLFPLLFFLPLPMQYAIPCQTMQLKYLSSHGHVKSSPHRRRRIQAIAILQDTICHSYISFIIYGEQYRTFKELICFNAFFNPGIFGNCEVQCRFERNLHQSQYIRPSN